MASGSAVISLPTYKANTRLSISKDIVECAEKDYQHILRSIAAQEIQQQIALNNKPSNIIVDGRGGKPINTAEKSVVAYFTDAAVVIKALNEAWTMIHGFARKDTGRSAGQFEIWINNKMVGTDPSAVKAGDIQRRPAVRIVGPMVAHTRKYQWLFGGKKPKMKTPKTIHQMTAQRMRSKYKMLHFVDPWVDTRDLNPKYKTRVKRVPSLTIIAKRKGGL